MYVLLPPENEKYGTEDDYYVFKMCLQLCWVFQCLSLFEIIYTQCRAEVFFIDWEKSTGDPCPNHEPNLSLTPSPNPNPNPNCNPNPNPNRSPNPTPTLNLNLTLTLTLTLSLTLTLTLTASGDRLSVPYPVSTAAAAYTTPNCL